MEEKQISRNLYKEIVFNRRKEDFPVKAVNVDLFRIGGSSQNSVEGSGGISSLFKKIIKNTMFDWVHFQWAY